ncbi:hypothetical protein RB195_003290 [Necator americanus]|uniref:Secreted protein n=1 Tax=Necator americanus TaxID=51031 RepID=A0ABR1DMV6_NECAM
MPFPYIKQSCCLLVIELCIVVHASDRDICGCLVCVMVSTGGLLVLRIVVIVKMNKTTRSGRNCAVGQLLSSKRRGGHSCLNRAQALMRMYFMWFGPTTQWA